MLRLMREMRQAIVEGPAAHEAFVRSFLAKHYPSHKAPVWVHESLAYAGIDISDSFEVEQTP